MAAHWRKETNELSGGLCGDGCCFCALIGCRGEPMMTKVVLIPSPGRKRWQFSFTVSRDSFEDMNA